MLGNFLIFRILRYFSETVAAVQQGNYYISCSAYRFTLGLRVLPNQCGETGCDWNPLNECF